MLIDAAELKKLAEELNETLSFCTPKIALMLATRQLEEDLAFKLGYRQESYRHHVLSSEERALCKRCPDSFEDGRCEGQMDPENYRSY